MPTPIPAQKSPWQAPGYPGLHQFGAMARFGVPAVHELGAVHKPICNVLPNFLAHGRSESPSSAGE